MIIQIYFGNCAVPVSYTHLDVYKRQVVGSAVEDVLDRKPFGLGRGVLPRVVGFEVDHRLPPGTDAHGEECALSLIHI